MDTNRICIDGNEAAVRVAYRLSELCALYPITPSSPMGELADQWANAGRPNLWGNVPEVVQMQSEAGAAGTLHGALQTGALATTFTASQGLLLMLPNLYKIAGGLLPCVVHVAARTVATHALSIFGDHSDVMAARQTGFAILSSANVQEAHDFALVAHAATLASRLPFVHFFDGFRSSHEVNSIVPLSDHDLRALMPDGPILAHRARALSPDHPVIRGTSQNPDVFFQSREAANTLVAAVPGIARDLFARLAERTGRSYDLVDYVGAADAEAVMVLMGSGAETARATVEHLVAQGEKLGVLQVRLYRPWPGDLFLEKLPESVRRVLVLDRTKEPGAPGEPLYLDVAATVQRSGRRVQVLGGRYGLSSKEFTPAMVQAVFRHATRHDFTVGIEDDVTHLSLPVDESFHLPLPDTREAVFYGLGSDGTVGANRDAIRIIGAQPGLYAQGYFVFDSNKAGSRTVSHLRYGPSPIHAPYLIRRAGFVACHQHTLLRRVDVLECAAEGATFLLNSPLGPERVWESLPRTIQEKMRALGLRFFVIDATKVAREAGLGSRINTVMLTCFFQISAVLPGTAAMEAIRAAIRRSYARKGAEVVQRNLDAVDRTLEHLHEVPLANAGCDGDALQPMIASGAEPFVQRTIGAMMAGNGDRLPVSALPVDGSFPLGTAVWEKRNIAAEIPVWEPELCTQCGNCVFVCPHAVIRVRAFEEDALSAAPEGFASAKLAGRRNPPSARYTLQIHAEDCTGCGLCVDVCPAKSKERANVKAINMSPKPDDLSANRAHLGFFETLVPREPVEDPDNVRSVQYAEPLFAFPGACAGCGETAYLRLLSQLFGDRLLIANATGCSSIFGGNLPTTPWMRNADGRGPAWANSLFEDNAEFGLGLRVSVDFQTRAARDLLMSLRMRLDDDALVDATLNAPQDGDAAVAEQRRRVAALKQRVASLGDEAVVRHFLSIADLLVRRSVWLVGGDGWAYDIGFGGLDHVLAGGRNVNVLVLDTEVYSNTGGQASKATPRGAVAKFAAGGKRAAKKDLAQAAIAAGNVYVARVAMGANRLQTLNAFREAEAYPGPSLVIAYAHCIAHGIPMSNGLRQQDRAVQSGHWPLFRYGPSRAENRLVLDSTEPGIRLAEYREQEIRYRLLTQTDPKQAEVLCAEAEAENRRRFKWLQDLAGS